MQQTELHNEFNQLVQKITEDVLKLTVIKSVENASNEIKKQVPSIEKNSTGLRRSIEMLQEVSQELSIHLQELKTRENRHDHQLNSILQKVEGSRKNIEKFEDKIVRVEKEIGKEFVSNKQMISNLDKEIQMQLNDILVEQRQQIQEVVASANKIGNESKKIALWNLRFSMGAFGVTIVILLNALSII